MQLGLELFGGFRGEELVERDQATIIARITPAADSRPPSPSTKYYYTISSSAIPR